jgi:hypothetical protein
MTRPRSGEGIAMMDWAQWLRRRRPKASPKTNAELILGRMIRHSTANGGAKGRAQREVAI